MRVLVVDDDVRLAGLIGRSLEAEGFRVRATHDGQAGFDLATSQEFDVLVLDIMLPGLNGYDVCRRLRASGNTVPILMLSAKDGEYDEADGLDVGADDYLTKPFSYLVLAARLRALIRRGAANRPPVLRIGELTVDPAAQRCFAGEHEVVLTAREFAVLAYLAARPGQVVAKAEIIENVWDFAYDGDFNIVEVYISALRRKLDPYLGTRLINTVRGAGYRIQ
ncbi:DNA-binding response regulator [Pseudonocardiaceae bacterium YIM PH 21723]|nr:DNA-binding response regulator [Pseudonocardiaceae bacterium YIM PH 21723]